MFTENDVDGSEGPASLDGVSKADSWTLHPFAESNEGYDSVWLGWTEGRVSMRGCEISGNGTGNPGTTVEENNVEEVGGFVEVGGGPRSPGPKRGPPLRRSGLYSRPWRL